MPQQEKYDRRVVVKFKDSVDIPYEHGGEKHFKKPDLLEKWTQLYKQFPGISFKKLFVSLSPQEILKQTKRARRLDPKYKPPNFLTYFAIDCPEGVNPDALVQALLRWEIVQVAYIESLYTVPTVNYNYNDFAKQGYLQPADKRGIDAIYAWSKGYDGDGVGFVDIEKGWKLDHNDLIDKNITIIDGVEEDFQDIPHGTNVLGVVVAVDNGWGCLGIAPNAQARVISICPNFSLADRILAAVNQMNKGDVLLIELQTEDDLPVEVEHDVFKAIRQAYTLGITVIEPAGQVEKSGRSAASNLDKFTRIDPVTQQQTTIEYHWLDRNSQALNPDSLDFEANWYNPNFFHESKAIMVGAVSGVNLAKLDKHNYGSRIDCYAWGSNVHTLSTNENGSTSDYTPSFSGTSSAAAIIAGVVVIIQEIAKKTHLGHPFAKEEFKELQRILWDKDKMWDQNKVYGTDVPDERTRIGSMPDLQKIIDNYDWFGWFKIHRTWKQWVRILKIPRWPWIRLPIPPRPPEPQNKGGRSRPIA